MSRTRRERLSDPMASPYNPDPPKPVETVQRVAGLLPGDLEIHLARLDALAAVASVHGSRRVVRSSEQMGLT